MKSPYPWFGGKAQIAAEVWTRFGEVANYVEPFYGGGAVHLARPGWTPGTKWTETVNDINAWLVNFWRAVKADPDAVAEYASDPVSELDLHARGDAMFYKGVRLTNWNNKRIIAPDEFCERIRSDPEWYDAKVAGWWGWGQSSWIGDNWGPDSHNARRDSDGNACGVTSAVPRAHSPCGVSRKRPHLSHAGKGINRKLPHLGDAGRGVSRSLPHLGDPGMGINRKLPHLGNPGRGVNRKLETDEETCGDGTTDTSRKAGIRSYMRQLCDRMAYVRICCGDWRRVLGPSPTTKLGLTGVFLDPPYGIADRETVYGPDDSRDIADDVRRWCIDHHGDPGMRVAICGYEDQDALASHGWRAFQWKAPGGYANQGDAKGVNATREIVWFSPCCLEARQGDMFEGETK